jgi:spore germination protein GerM
VRKNKLNKKEQKFCVLRLRYIFIRKKVANMKKIILLLLSVFIILAFAACGAAQPKGQDSGTQNENSEIPGDAAEIGSSSTVDDSESNDNSTQGGADPDENRVITLYFGNENADKVVSEKREITLSKGESIEKHVFEELLKGPLKEGSRSTIPEGTKLLSVSTKDGLCTLDLSSEFVDNHPGGSAGELMTLSSIVNSLTELPDIKQVQFLIEGQKREVYLHAIFDEPFSRYEEMIQKQ